MRRTRLSLVRYLLVCALLACVAGVARPGVTQAGAAVKVYTNSALHYSLTYPAGWTIDPKVDSKKIGAIEATINPVALELASPDNLGHFLVLSKTSATAGAAIKANIAGMLKEGPALIGGVEFSTVKVNGITYISGSATEKVGPSMTAFGYINGTSRGHFTYYAGGAYLLKQANSGNVAATMKGIMSSFTLL